MAKENPNPLRLALFFFVFGCFLSHGSIVLKTVHVRGRPLTGSNKKPLRSMAPRRVEREKSALVISDGDGGVRERRRLPAER